MSLASLNTLFKPTSVTVIGANEEPGSPGAVIMRNLLASKFIGPIIPVHETLEMVNGIPAYSEIDTLPLTPDLAIVCSEPETVPDYILQLGRRGTPGAVVLGTGFSRLPADVRTMLESAMLSAARQTSLRILGPNSQGFINPASGINASLAHMDALPGRTAFVTQSGSLFTAVLDWARYKNIGFSHFISVGDRLDIRFSTVLDFLCQDPYTRAILLYLETVKDARKFMSAARAVSRNKPVLMIKAGRTEEGARRFARFGETRFGSDDVYDAAFRRAGMLRVFDINSLFEGVETIARAKPLKGERPIILANGRNPGLLAADLLIEVGGGLTGISDEAKKQLTELVREDPYETEIFVENPVTLPANARPEQYAAAMDILLRERNVDALLVMHAPSAVVACEDAAKAVAEASQGARKNVLTSWVGGESAEKARRVFSEAGIPTYPTPDTAVRAFLHLVRYRRNQQMLLETPPSLPSRFIPETSNARLVVQNALAANRTLLSVPEAMSVLAAYGIPVVETRLAATTKGAVKAASEMGYPVALKILSPDIVRKTQAGGVALDLENMEAVHEAALGIKSRVDELNPNAHMAGFIVQKMGRRPGAHELFIEAGTDPVFGPFIRFGQGGAGAALIADYSTALPPLNMNLAKELVLRTRIHKVLGKPDSVFSADIDAICLTLVKVSQLIIDVPEVHALEINPLFGDRGGVLALDAQIHVAEARETGAKRLAIRPYPKELEECVVLKDGRRLHLKPIRPEDEPAHWEFLSGLSAQDMRYRFFGYISEMPRSEMIRFTQIDYDREMAFIASTSEEGDPDAETLGVVRAMTEPDNSSAEFAIVVRSDMKGLGLGRLLMEKIIRYCKERGTKYLKGHALIDNAAMAGLAKAMGFDVKKNYGEDLFDFKMLLNPE
ncbi:MAG: bifunctional acetate--CoA ligase family protein/GNAT family N-acetyltransferase [Thermodesulfobacteriota bacterium]|nr:bifunctional acetate--CoA ligase family protein/GNAT family N-acetyltransferase [Thermodesulfobacteriota bacterium]